MAQARPLPMPQRGTPIFTKAGPMPTRRAAGTAGAKARAWGTAAKEVGGHIMDYQKYRDAGVQAQGKADMEAQIQNARLQQMIKNRQLGMRIQAAKERWQNAQWQIDLLEEKRNKEQHEQQTEAHKWRGEDRQIKQARQKNIIDFEREFNNRIAKSKGEGGQPFRRQDALRLANMYEVGEDPRVRGMIKDYWPAPARGSTAGARKQKVAAKMVGFLEDELMAINDRIERIAGQTFEKSFVLYNPITYEKTISKMPVEPEKRAALRGLQKEMRQKRNELHKAMAEAGISGGPGGESPLATEREISELQTQNNKLLELIEELEAQEE